MLPHWPAQLHSSTALRSLWSLWLESSTPQPGMQQSSWKWLCSVMLSGAVCRGSWALWLPAAALAALQLQRSASCEATSSEQHPEAGSVSVACAPKHLPSPLARAGGPRLQPAQHAHQATGVLSLREAHKGPLAA